MEQAGLAPEIQPAPSLARGEPNLPGPFAVGRWAAGFRDFLRGRPRVRLLGEVVNCSQSAKAVYFDLRDADGAVPCAIWRSDLDRLELPDGALRDGVELVVAGGPDYYPGGERSSPAFSFRVGYLRLAGEGDLLAQLERLRRRLAEEGLFEPQKLLPRPAVPRAIGVVVGRESAALGDIRAGLARRSWRGRLILAHPPVQGRAAAPRIAAAVRELAALPDLGAIVVARGGGSLTDLWCFCDESLCRTVAALPVPVVSAVGHEVDRTLIDDVAAVACSTPTHAAEAAVAVDVAAARARLGADARTLTRHRRATVSARARGLGALARTLGGHARAERGRLHQAIREVRAASRRLIAGHGDRLATFALVLRRRRRATLHEAASERARVRAGAGSLLRHRGQGPALRRQRLASLTATLIAHDPDQVLDRGYALVEAQGGGVLTSAAAARSAGRLRVRFADDHVEVEVIDDR